MRKVFFVNLVIKRTVFMGFMKKDKNILNHEYMEMFEKRQADIRRIADSLTVEEFVALELFYL